MPRPIPAPIRLYSKNPFGCRRRPPGLMSAARVLLSSVLAACTLVACAKVGPPGGGPQDRTAPGVVEHLPAKDATSVPLDTRIEILFSEDMDRQRTEDALFVAPLVELRRRWQGRRLHLRPAAPLQPNRTYVITVGTGARDLRNNALSKAFTLAFATGPRLNRGRLEGTVFDGHQPARTVHVWAYPAEGEQRLGLDPPAYRTQADAKGAYEFSRLSAGDYLPVAFADADRDQAWDPGERLALPAGPVRVDEDTAAVAGDLALWPRSDGAPRLERLQALDGRRLLLLFAAETDPAEVELAVEGLAVEALYGQPDEKRKVYAATALQEAGRVYRLQRLQVGGAAVAWDGELRGSGRQGAPPGVARLHPAAGAAFVGRRLRLTFDRPMAQILPERLWDGDGVPEGTWRWQGPTQLEFVAARPLASGAYDWGVRLHLLRGRTGLAPADSTARFEFSVPPPEALAAVEGRVVDAAGAASEALLVLEGKEATYHTASGPDGAFGLKGVLPGAYVLYAFIDRDGDGLQGRGRPHPFVAAEPYLRLDGPVTVKAGQALEDLQVVFR